MALASTHHTDMVICFCRYWMFSLRCFVFLFFCCFFFAFVFEHVLLCGSMQLMVNQMCIVVMKRMTVNCAGFHKASTLAHASRKCWQKLNSVNVWLLSWQRRQTSGFWQVEKHSSQMDAHTCANTAVCSGTLTHFCGFDFVLLFIFFLVIWILCLVLLSFIAHCLFLKGTVLKLLII